MIEFKFEMKITFILSLILSSRRFFVVSSSLVKNKKENPLNLGTTTLKELLFFPKLRHKRKSILCKVAELERKVAVQQMPATKRIIF